MAPRAPRKPQASAQVLVLIPRRWGRVPLPAVGKRAASSAAAFTPKGPAPRSCTWATGGRPARRRGHSADPAPRTDRPDRRLHSASCPRHPRTHCHRRGRPVRTSRDPPTRSPHPSRACVPAVTFASGVAVAGVGDGGPGGRQSSPRFQIGAQALRSWRRVAGGQRGGGERGVTREPPSPRTHDAQGRYSRGRRRLTRGARVPPVPSPRMACPPP